MLYAKTSSRAQFSIVKIAVSLLYSRAEAGCLQKKKKFRIFSKHVLTRPHRYGIIIALKNAMMRNSRKSSSFQRDAGWCEALEALSRTHRRAADMNEVVADGDSRNRVMMC